MKNTEEEIIEIAKKVMKDFRNEYYTEECIDGLFYKEEQEIISGKNEGKIFSAWVVSVYSFFDNIDFLCISDDTGEPLYYQNFNTIVLDIEKSPEGKFSRVDIE